ncbi:MAG: DNA adenine methylase [Treponema sp.]|nr:DNA adenine methylase [Treponema sp.]
MGDNSSFFESQLITYIGNKRSLLDFIGQGLAQVQKELNKENLTCLDLFSGSGIVARYLKQFSSCLAVNDLELYSCIINRCYLSNPGKEDEETLRKLHKKLVEKINCKMEEIEKSRKEGTYSHPGFISELYSPQNLDDIKENERCFYTPYNANYLDVARQMIQSEVPESLQPFFIAPLLSEASIHANTAGIFKGFYKNSKTGRGQFGGNGKNALSRITGKIELKMPLFLPNGCKTFIFNQNADSLVTSPELYACLPSSAGGQAFDLAYFDPPYNQHPYGSNYFMLNLIADYKRPDPAFISRVSGIPKDWNRSDYNKRKKVADVFYNLVKNVKTRFVLISFNSEGFIKKEDMISLLNKIGKVQVMEAKYNAFRASRNLSERNIHVNEYLFLLDKRQALKEN